jgi:hypothetical protein
LGWGEGGLKSLYSPVRKHPIVKDHKTQKAESISEIS